MVSNPNTQPSHDQAPASPAELSPQEQAILSIDKVAEWRGYETIKLNDALTNNLNVKIGEVYEQFAQSQDIRLEEYLQQNGIDKSSANYDKVYQLFQDNRFGNGSSIPGINITEWNVSPAYRGGDPHDTKSGADHCNEQIQQLKQQFGVTDASPDTNPSPDTPDDTDTTNLDELSNRLGEARTKLAELDAKRAGRAFSFGKDTHNELRGQYDELVQQLGREKLKDVLADDNVSPQDKNLKVVEYILGQQKELREATIENMKNSKVRKFVNWMNKGSAKVRFIKGITVGVAAGALGTLLAGATGAAAIAVTTTAAARFVKGYASSEGKTGTKMTSEMSQEDRDLIMKELAKVQYDGSNTDDNTTKDRVADALNQSRSIDERDIKKEQKGRRRSLAMGAVAVGLGAAVTGVGAEYVRDHLHDIPQLWHPFDTPVGATKPPIIDIHDPNSVSGGGAGGNTLSGMPDPSSIDTFVDNLSAEAHTVMPGEGWNQTMLDMGIPKDHWNSILTQAGPELQNQGWAYFDNAHGEWRISQPGQLPNDVLRTIADYAQRDGYTLGA